MTLSSAHLCIRSGRVIDPANGVDQVQDLFITAGHIAGLGIPPPGFVEEKRIDARGCIVCPGLVDLQARLREPGQEHKGTIDSETWAAACGGVTTLCCPPDTSPPIDTPAVVELIRQRAEQTGRTRILPVGALTQGLKGKQLSEMAALAKAGCVAVGNGRRAISNTYVMRRAMEYAATYGLTVFLDPEDSFLRAQGCVHEGIVSSRLGLPGIPKTAETVAVARDLLLIEQTGVRAHFCQLSTARAVVMVSRAHQEGLPVTAAVSAHHLHLTEMDIGDFNCQYHIQPPLRTQRDREGLRAGLAEGVLVAVCSDHQPHDANAKLAPFSATEAGISALETLLPLSLRLVEQGLLSFPEMIARLTWHPAQVLGIKAGTLSIGTRADICIFDPALRWQLSERTMRSQGLNTPFLGWEFTGQVTHTLLGGDIVYQLND